MEQCDCSNRDCIMRDTTSCYDNREPSTKLEHYILEIFDLIKKIKRKTKVMINCERIVLGGAKNVEFEKVRHVWIHSKYYAEYEKLNAHSTLKCIDKCKSAQHILNTTENEVFKKYFLWREKHAAVIQKYMSLDDRTVGIWRSKTCCGHARYLRYRADREKKDPKFEKIIRKCYENV